jgi:hypothetical protein
MAQPAIPNPVKASSIETGLTPKGKTAPAKPAAKAQPTTSVDIMKAAIMQGGGSPKDADAFINNLGRAIQAKRSQIVQIYKTVFLLNMVDNKAKPLPPGTVEMYPFTVEPESAAARIKVLPSTLKQMGFKKLISRTDDADDVAMMKSTGLPINVRQEMVYDGRQMSPMYMIEMDL